LPEVRVENWIVGDAFNLLVASHTGYQRLSEPVLHRRKVFQLKDGFWFILDTAEGEGIHDFDVYWHLAPGFEWQVDSKSATAGCHKAGVAIVTTEQLFATRVLERVGKGLGQSS
jgi:hypothetical protein